MPAQTPADPAAQFLLASRDPSVRYFTLTDLLGAPAAAKEAEAERARIVRSARVRQLLAMPPYTYSDVRQPGDAHPYRKWDGAHWRLVSLVELGIPPGHRRACAAVERELAWLTGNAHRSQIRAIDGRTRHHASQEGNALAVCARLGLAGDPRAQGLARDLVAWQWPDGGWNCDKRPPVVHSSFYESLAPLWGLIEYHKATSDAPSLAAAKRAAEALDLVAAKRRNDGCWRAEGYYWRPAGTRGSNAEVVDWGRGGPNEWITLNALRVLKADGRWL